jgi:surfeit locus 1 family protein
MTEAAKRHFQFKPGLTFAALLGFATLIALGYWQLERLEWKRALIERIESQRAATPAELPSSIDDPEAWEFRRVLLQGRFLHDHETFLVGRSHQGVTGLHVMTPMLLKDGRSILVDRGWIPIDKRDPETRPKSLPEGEIDLVALLALGGWKGRQFLRPQNDVEKDNWFWPDLPAMAAQAGLERPVTALFGYALKSPDGAALPIPDAPATALRNDHLQYAITWFALAVGLAIIYFFASFEREPRANRDQPS